MKTLIFSKDEIIYENALDGLIINGFKFNHKKYNYYYELTNHFKYIEFDSCDFDRKRKTYYLFLIDDSTIFGYVQFSIVETQKAIFHNQEFKHWILSIEVLPQYRNKGYSKFIYVALFDYLKSIDIKYVLGSSFSDMGKHMLNSIQTIAKQSNFGYVRPENTMRVSEANKTIDFINTL